TGRTANAVPILYTAYDLQRLEESGKRMMDILNISNSNIVVNAFPYAPHLAFWQTFYAIKGINLLGLHTGGGRILGTEKIIASIESMKATCLVGMPGYAYHLIRTAKEQKRDLSSLNLIIFGGERVPIGLREKIRNELKAMGSKAVRVLSTYGLTEGKCAWVECKEGSGYHLYPDFEFIEIVDKNNERVNEGEKGEIVYTSLDWRGSIFLRYKTGDITKGIYYEKCQHCGRTLPRIDGAIERSSEYKEFKLAKIKGSFVNLNAFFPIMMSHKGIEEWQIEIRKKNNDPYEIDELVVYVAPKKKANFEKLKNDLARKITAETEVTPEIANMGLKELLQRLGMETELKEKRIVDNREKI
ncbi:AMP-binding protein, partial [Candidatus Woesearchaeota archaeon]|nr:AMP-binding protein [Candidatus Woesearchaeota archaeon]